MLLGLIIIKKMPLKKNPTYHKKVDSGICYFYTDLQPNLDIVKQIEEHTPIKDNKS